MTPMTSSLSRHLLCALVAIALLPTAAQADASAPAVPVPAADALTTSAHSLAVARWGVEPCGGQVTVTWAHMGGGINARSQWMSVDIHNPATYSECSITYNLDVDWDWPKLCTVIEHELGHLAGHEHVNDSHDVMSPYYIFPSPECATAQPGAQAAPAPVTVAQAPAVAAPRKATSKRKVAKAKVAVKPKAKVKVSAKAQTAKAKSAKAKAAKAKAAKAKATARNAKGRSAPTRSKKATRGRARARAAVVVDSRDPAVLFGCALVSA
jgi:hypothetical protein